MCRLGVENTPVGGLFGTICTADNNAGDKVTPHTVGTSDSHRAHQGRFTPQGRSERAQRATSGSCGVYEVKQVVFA